MRGLLHTFDFRVSDDFLYRRNVTLSTGNVIAKKWKQKLPWTANENDGLSITLTKIPEVNYKNPCRQLAFAVHNVDEMPTDFDNIETCEIKHGMALDVLITPEVLNTDEDLRSFPISERQCYMDGERKLKFFKKYSVRNCEMECTSLVTLEMCGCVPFYTIRNSTAKICGASLRADDYCKRLAEMEVRMKSNDTAKSCNCLPTCNSLTYNLEYFYNEIKTSDNETDELNKTTISFRFKDAEIFPQRRYRQLTIFGLISESAGLFALHCGVSLLTVVELAYFLSLRVMSNFVRRFTN
jgi:Amiloride-sensitive sodium channel